MKRNQMTRDELTCVATSNGLSTFTANVFNTPLKTYTPLENGFNAELAEDVYSIIEANPFLWNQGTWRSIEMISATYSPDWFEAIGELSAVPSPADSPACGTSMCFAGWADELAKVDWLIDGYWLKVANKAGDTEFRQETGDISNDFTFDLTAYAEEVLMPLTKAEKDNNHNAQDEWDHLPIALRERLATRGFTIATHKIVTVVQAARQLLGVGDDPLSLFGASNELEEIRTIIDAYTRYGSRPTKEQVREFRGDPNACNCRSCQSMRASNAGF